MHVLLMSLFLSLAPTACRATTAPTPVDAGASTPVATPSRDAAAKPKLSLEEARAAALKQVPGTVIRGELEREHGRWIDSIEIQPTDRQQPRREVEIDGDDGSVIAVEDEGTDD